jgi:aspartate/methionine/tyrosine aminotransferase
MAERTIVVGSASKELRMIGWRVGWVVGPPAIVEDVGLVGISNVVCQVGIAQAAVEAALRGDDGVAAFAAELERRRDLIQLELDGLPVLAPHGGWSLLLDTGALGVTGAEASARLFEHGRIAATPMENWGGEDTARYLRFVFANEPLERLEGLGERVRRALGVDG